LSHRLKANEGKPEIQVIKDYGEFPPLECYPGQLNQVFLNILANAIDALEEWNSGRSRDEIKANPNKLGFALSLPMRVKKLSRIIPFLML
jgi:signal transduction histidine kinase